MLNKILSDPLSDSDLDLWSQNAIFNWPQYTKFETVYDGLNYAELTRCFLWDKVSRAIRRQACTHWSAFEESLFNQSEPISRKSSRYQVFNQNLRKQLRPMSALVRTSWISTISKINQKPIIYIPRSHYQLQKAVNALSSSKTLLAITHSSQKFNSAKLKSISTLSTEFDSQKFSTSLHGAIIQGLQAQGIELLSKDKRLLLQEIQQQQQFVTAANTELSMLKPSGIFVFTDNHSPSQEYVHVANCLGIPSIMLQHGLDCESFCLDEAYASTIAVWGESRAQRYLESSLNQPLLRVTGNPEYDHLRLPEESNWEGKYWLWLTRPHISQKCFAPSRHPEEGLVIFDALASVLEKFPEIHLIIKPHPSDYISLYEQQIKDKSLEQRISVSSQPIENLVNAAKIVFSEDSTAALGAMFNGKPLIHLHFTKTPPVLPMAEFGAALPAYSKEMLHDALIYINQFTLQEKYKMLRSQRAFIEHFAGPCDGTASQRVLSLIEETLVRQ